MGDTVKPVNWQAWAIGYKRESGRFFVRRIVWGRLLAREEKREWEVIRRAIITLPTK